MKMSVLKYGVLFALLLTSTWGYSTDTISVKEGEKLFTLNCKACHNLKMRLVGPALTGVENRHDEAWLLRFIKSSQTVIQSGDSVANALFNQYNKVVMPDHHFSDSQIKSILAYIKEAGNPTPSMANKITRPVVAQAGPVTKPLKFSDVRFWILYTVTVVLVIVSIYYKAELIALRKKVDHTDEGSET